MSSAKVEGKLDITERTVLGILDEEAKKATGAATRRVTKEINAKAPVGPTSGRARKANPAGAKLSKGHRPSVRRKEHGYAGLIRRVPDVWYGRIVEKGRKAGRGRGQGRRYPAARANPFVDRGAAAVEREAQTLLEAGADRAADRIEARL